jgi:MFS family permease
MAASNTVIQTIVDDDKRGLIMSIYVMSFIGAAPFGSLLAGFLAHKIGAPETLLFSGILCVLGAAIFASKLPNIKEKIRPIYIKLGIIPQVSSGIQTATNLTVPPED